MFQNKVVIITGASSGIGKACAMAFAEKKASLVLAARNEEKLKESSIACEKLGAKSICIQTDVADEEQCKALINKALNTFGTIDILINNAGISMRALFADTELKVLKELMDVNFWGAVYCTKYALPYLLKSKGSLVGISSIAGFRALPARTGYSASKFALNAFLETLRTENLKTGLHVLTVAPGFTASNIRKTARTAKGEIQAESPRNEKKMMSAEKVAEKTLNAIAKRKKILILGFQGKITVILNKLFPAWMDTLVYNHLAKEEDAPFK
jgi:short-subunit dehydrogenase